MPELSLGLMSMPASWAEATLHAQWAEGGGFSSLWTGDHLRHPRDLEAPFLDGWTLLPAWATVTGRVRIGVLVSNLIYRQPALLARQAAAVDVISGGRLVLGLGAGVYDTDHGMAGVPTWTPRERVARLAEFLAVLGRLLTGEVVDAEGPYYPMTAAVVRPQPLQRPRPELVVGALGPRMIELAVRFGDVWNTWGGQHPDRVTAVEAVRRQSAQVDRACEAVGRDPATLRRSLYLYPPLDPWSSSGALAELVTTFLPLGITEYVVLAPSTDRAHLLEQLPGRLFS